jgi:hypothetical protein
MLVGIESNTYDSAFILYSIRDNIDSEDRTKIVNIVSYMLDEIKQVKEKFVLEPEEETIRSHLIGHLNDVWTILHDSRPDNMSGYSRMSEPDNELLSPHILKLHNMLEDIFKRLR